jgi:chromosome condensin MukBEF MukE localization factor
MKVGKIVAVLYIYHHLLNSAGTFHREELQNKLGSLSLPSIATWLKFGGIMTNLKPTKN